MSTTDRQAERISNSRRVAEEALKSGDDFPEFIETLTPKELGYLGEALACSYLEERGLEVVERQYRCREGEADIIAHDLDSDEIDVYKRQIRDGRAARRLQRKHQGPEARWLGHAMHRRVNRMRCLNRMYVRYP